MNEEGESTFCALKESVCLAKPISGPADSTEVSVIQESSGFREGDRRDETYAVGDLAYR